MIRLSIVSLKRGNSKSIRDCARLLHETFGPHSDWPDVRTARRTVMESLREGRISRVAIRDRAVVGWIAAESQYDGRVWEIHPLVVAQEHQRSGVGRALVHNLERALRAKGAYTLWAGSDDEDNRTTLGSADLYRDLPAAIANIRNLKRHPYEFYLKMGFAIVGVMPDANGFGKPDIFLAKRIRRRR